jgi:L-histidine Nalpha-methyltransferase
MKTPRFIQLDRIDSDTLVGEAVAGLLADDAALPPKFFYDELGSRLFDAITQLAEYYPTRTEASILADQREAIVAAALALTGAAPQLVDLGAGSCAKAARLLPALLPSRYVALDISADFLRQALHQLQQAHPQLEMVGVGLDFSKHLALPAPLAGTRSLVFYPGSSIGNFDPAQALQLLQQAREVAAGGALLIGVDLVKAKPVLDAAYDDNLGVTAAFNLNLLTHLNRLIGADFNPRQWQHVAFFDAARSRVEMHLQAREALWVRFSGGERRFEAGERIHTENSYKWTLGGFGALLRDAGYGQVQHWVDEQGWFAVFLAAA